MYKVLVSFSGIISAYKGQIIEIDDKLIAKDLLEAGYIKPVSDKPSKENKKEETPK